MDDLTQGQAPQQPVPNLQPATAPTAAQLLMASRQRLQELNGQAKQQAPVTQSPGQNDPFAPEVADSAGAMASKEDDNAAFLQDSGVNAERPKGYDPEKMKHYMMNFADNPATHEATAEGGWWSKVEQLRGMIADGTAHPQEAIQALMETEPELMAIADKHHPHGGATHHRSMLTHPDLHDTPALLNKANAAGLGG